MSERLDLWRADTPGCAGRIHLNNAGAALMPRPVHQAMHDHLALEGELGGYEAADARADAVAAAHAAVAVLAGTDARHIAFTSSATAAFVQAMSAFDLQRGDVVVTTRADYTSYQIQFLSLAQRLGIAVVHAENGPDGGVDPQSVREILRRTPCRLVHVSWIPTHSGLVQDVAAVGSVCEEAGVPYLVDACQAVGQMPIDVAALKCDYLTATARKFLRGPRGIGFLYASERALRRGDHPLFVDMRGATWVDPRTYRLVETAARFEEWECAYALVLGLGAAAEYAAAVGIDVAHARAWRLAARLRTMLSELPGVRVLDPGDQPSAIVTASLGRPAGPVMQQLRTFGINTSATQRWYGLRSFEGTDVESALRLSPHYYNTDDELDRAVGTLGGILRSESRHS
jgi:selenocysteine lyase/cysteine desulfurase